LFIVEGMSLLNLFENLEQDTLYFLIFAKEVKLILRVLDETKKLD